MFNAKRSLSLGSAHASHTDYAFQGLNQSSFKPDNSSFLRAGSSTGFNSAIRSPNVTTLVKRAPRVSAPKTAKPDFSRPAGGASKTIKPAVREPAKNTKIKAIEEASKQPTEVIQVFAPAEAGMYGAKANKPIGTVPIGAIGGASSDEAADAELTGEPISEPVGDGDNLLIPKGHKQPYVKQAIHNHIHGRHGSPYELDGFENLPDFKKLQSHWQKHHDPNFEGVSQPPRHQSARRVVFRPFKKN